MAIGQHDVTSADVYAAAERIADAVMNTPCVASETLSAITACSLFLKFENLQFTASFKERGALNKLLTLSLGERGAGVCAMSAGNHAQSLAYHARRLGVPATIVMPKGTPLTKIARTRDHGATVIIEGDNLTEALLCAERQAAQSGLTFVDPFDDVQVIAGQGTIALEMLDALPDLEILLVPIGGGGLISGIATAAKALKPGIEIVGVQSRTYPSMLRAIEGKPPEARDGLTIAEGIAVKTPGLITRRIVSELVDEILLVDESHIEQAVALLLSVEKTVVEGAGAAGLAAIFEHAERFRGRRVGTILSGGNIDLRVLASVALRSLVRNGQLVRLSISINDRPGVMARLATLIGDAGANIVEIEHDRLSLALNAKGAQVDIVAEVQDRVHGEQLRQTLEQAGFHCAADPLAAI